MKNIASLLMKIFVIVIGVFSLIFGIKFLSIDTSSLKEVQAVILSSSWGSTDDFGNDSYNVTYSYSVMGNQYEGSFSGAEGYTEGEKITVYYDPQSPETSYSSKGESTLLGIIGIMFGLFCLGSLLWGVIKSKIYRAKDTETPPAIQNYD